MSSEPSLPILATLGLDLEHDIQAVLQAAADHLWLHASPWQALTTCADRRLLVSGHGCTVVDAHGRAYLDALSGLWLVNVGHGRSAIAEAMAQQAKTLAYASASRAATLPAIQLATLLARLTPASGAPAGWPVELPAAWRRGWRWHRPGFSPAVPWPRR